MAKLTNQEFVKRAELVHGKKYDYSKTEYKGYHEKVYIVCREKDEFGREHGGFWQTPGNHLNGKGCPKCSKLFRYDTQYFIETAELVHGKKYDYSKAEYKNNNTKVVIKCRVHGYFEQFPNNHLRGCGCSKCNNVGLSVDEWIARFKEKHGDKYDYSKFEYKGNEIKSCFICPEHGEFWQTPAGHLSSSGCLKCSIESRRNKRVLPLNEFIERANHVHNNKYDYSDVEYNNLREKVTIICPEHGSFQQEAFSHLAGCSCPKCSHSVSEQETGILDYIRQLLPDTEVISRCRNLIPPQEIDIYIPAKKFGIEYNGLVWHSEKYTANKRYHLDKTEKCEKQGVKLIQIFEDEYKEHKQIVLSKIKHLLKYNAGEKIHARKTVVCEIDTNTAKSFLTSNHIQGFSPSSVYVGCSHNGILCGVMAFRDNGGGKWELTRFASDIDKLCVGIGGKMFRFFLNQHNPTEVKSFADRRWTTNGDNNFYTKNGFKLSKIIPPDYRYYSTKHGIKRFHKSNFRKDKIEKHFNISTGDKTESQIMSELGFYKIWDCGLFKYVWTNGT